MKAGEKKNIRETKLYFLLLILFKGVENARKKKNE